MLWNDLVVREMSHRLYRGQTGYKKAVVELQHMKIFGYLIIFQKSG